MKEILFAIGLVGKELGCNIRAWRIPHRKTLPDLGPEALLAYLNKTPSCVELGDALDNINDEQSVSLRSRLRATLLRRSHLSQLALQLFYSVFPFWVCSDLNRAATHSETLLTLTRQSAPDSL
ncbi:MAG: hypothetical protein ABSB15_14755 [Bryobacteraceae bacterium]|jgi:hypothetical protein